MIQDIVLFAGLALVAVASAVGMLLSKNAIYSALNLILNFLTIAMFYFLLAAPFIALVQVTVYAGAIMVLFLFVIMLLGAERLPGSPALGWQRPLAIILAAILVLESAYIIVFRPGPITPSSAAEISLGAPSAIGEVLFNSYLLPFEIVSILLLVAMIGAIVLTKRQKRDA